MPKDLTIKGRRNFILSFYESLEKTLLIVIAVIFPVVFPLFFGSVSEYLIFFYYIVISFLALSKDGYIYASLVFCIWIFVAFVRRVVDYQLGYDEQSFIMLSPYLASLIGILKVFKFAFNAWSYISLGLFFILFYLALGFGFNGPVAAIWDALGFLSPIVFVLYIYIELPSENKHKLMRIAGLLGGGVGLYGVFQYIYVPPWDAYWMLNIKVISFGLPEPGLIRVFSTMNAPAVYAAYLVFGICCLLGISKVKYYEMLFVIVMLVALLLTSVRASWGALVIIMSVYFLLSDNVRKINLSLGLVMVALVILGTLDDDVVDKISNRFDSLANVSEDYSLLERFNTYGAYMEKASLIGEGFGSIGAASGERIDGGYLKLLINFGYLGTGVILALLIFIFMLAFKNISSRNGIVWLSFFSTIFILLIFDNYIYGIYGLLYFLALVFVVDRSSA